MEPIGFLGATPDEHERAIIGVQIGRDPRGEIAVSARCEHGLPAVIRTAPRIDDQTPFPTLYWLTCPMAVRAVGRLEAAGRMRAYDERLASDPAMRAAYEDAHRRYVAQRDAIEPLGRDESAGGMPVRVKCLHALYAHELADANPVGAIVRDEVEPLGCPGPCAVADAGGRFVPVPGHPGSKRH